MAEQFTADLLFIIFVLLIAAILGFLLGYFLRKSMKCKKCTEWEEENSSLKLRIKKIEEDYSALKGENIKLNEEGAALKLKIENLESEVRSMADKKTLKATLDSKTGKTKDDLQVVLGIGPKISRILNNRGITTWNQLSETSPDLINEYLLKDGGERYRIHNPATWPRQAKLADEGKWDELKAFQAGLVK
jgi:predicted flap endonuclease-1-like 5' DNA nuclease